MIVRKVPEDRLLTTMVQCNEREKGREEGREGEGERESSLENTAEFGSFVRLSYQGELAQMVERLLSMRSRGDSLCAVKLTF